MSNLVLNFEVAVKIIETIPDVDAEAAGTTYVILKLCEELDRLGKNTTLAVLGDQPSLGFVKGFPRGTGPQKLGNSPAMRRWLKREVEEKRVDIVHNHGLWMMPNVYPGWATKRSTVPYVVSPHGTLSEGAFNKGPFIKKLFWPIIQRPSLKHAACFHATAESEYEDIRRLGFNQPVAIIPNGIDVPLGAEYGKSEKKQARRILLFLARIHPIKGIDMLLKAWGKLQYEFPDWDLRIVGPETRYSSIYDGMVRDSDLQRVNFVGPLYGNEKFEAYRQADLYVLPTHSENFGITVAESLACGTPAVVCKGAPWQGLELEHAGWWPDIGADPLESALRAAMSLSPQQLTIMGKNGRQWMLRDFSWSRIASDLLDTYFWLLGRGEKPSCVILD